MGRRGIWNNSLKAQWWACSRNSAGRRASPRRASPGRRACAGHASRKRGPPRSSSGAGCQWVYVADQESDFYEPLQRCQQHGVDFVIRSYQDRRLAGAAGHLRPTLATAKVLGELTVTLRARGGEPARQATRTCSRCAGVKCLRGRNEVRIPPLCQQSRRPPSRC